MKIKNDKKSYGKVIGNLIEDSPEIKKQILQAEKEFKEGKFYTHEQVKKELGL